MRCESIKMFQSTTLAGWGSPDSLSETRLLEPRNKQTQESVLATALVAWRLLSISSQKSKSKSTEPMGPTALGKLKRPAKGPNPVPPALVGNPEATTRGVSNVKRTSRPFDYD